MTAEVCELLRRLTSVKAERSWNRMYQNVYYKAKQLNTKDAYMKLYGFQNPCTWGHMHLVLALEPSVLQIREGMNFGCDELPDSATLHTIAFATKSLSSMEQCYSYIEWEALGILHRPKNFHHYCFAKEIYVITDHNPLVAIINKNMSTLSQWLQFIMLHICQNSV